MGRSGALVLACLAASCSPETTGDAHIVERSYVSMGSELRLSAWTSDDRRAVSAFDRVFHEFDRIERLLSVWREGSDAQRLNDAAGERAVAVAPETLDALLAARQVSDWTEGKFDVTFGALSDVWRFDHDRDGVVPSSAQIAARLPLIDYTRLRLDTSAGTARLERRGMRVHLGGIGKGLAIDRAAAILRGSGVPDFLIQAGGDTYASGRRGDRPWRVGIRDPRGPEDRAFAALDLTDAALSISGDYERAFVRDGRRYHHIIDPDSGQPAAHARSAAVIAGRAILADALSTGIFIMGPADGMALVERLPGVEAVVVTAGNDVLVSRGLSGSLERRGQPTDAP
jgi:thiamine biosynthesis lipoprotein